MRDGSAWFGVKGFIAASEIALHSARLTSGQSREQSATSMKSVFQRGSRRSRRWLRLGAYYLSIVLVLSFICFEVLDLDGSDFPVPSKSPRIKLAEPHDLRRATLVSIQPWGAMPSAAVDD